MGTHGTPPAAAVAARRRRGLAEDEAVEAWPRVLASISTCKVFVDRGVFTGGPAPARTWPNAADS